MNGKGGGTTLVQLNYSSPNLIAIAVLLFIRYHKVCLWHYCSCCVVDDLIRQSLSQFCVLLFVNNLIPSDWFRECQAALG